MRMVSRLRRWLRGDAALSANRAGASPPGPRARISPVDLQRNVVLAVAAAVPSDWKRIVANYEIDFTHGRVDDVLIVYVRTENGRDVLDSVEHIPYAVNEMFFALRNGIVCDDDGKWNTAEMTIDDTGAYEFSFSYGPPKRINGVFDQDSYAKFNDYAALHASSPLAA